LFGALAVPDFTVFESKVLFAGYDAHLKITLWVTDGTPVGTVELTGGGPGSPLVGFGGGDPYAPDLAVLKGKALFEGYDSSYHVNLWVTDGTSAGTKQLAVKGANPLGLFVEGSTGILGEHNPDLTVFGDKVLFNGSDAGGRDNLWVIDGTSAGTHELTFVESPGLSPHEITVIGDKAVFAGGLYFPPRLWVTDGTSAGTRELPIVDPYDITALGSKALGADANGGLWITDGTAAGTRELPGLPFWNGFGERIDPELTVLGSKALFVDANGHLWITDGTAAGTKELPGPSFLNGRVRIDPGLTVLGSEALFSGMDKTGAVQLWVTDGTSAGTRELAVADAYGSGLRPTDITAFPVPPPPPSGLALGAASDSGVKGDRITNVTRTTITGKGEAGDKVSCSTGRRRSARPRSGQRGRGR
jgi:ELWxxDGT repeat protein